MSIKFQYFFVLFLISIIFFALNKLTLSIILAILLVLGTVSCSIYEKQIKVFKYVLKFISKLKTMILLGVVYYLVLFPTSIIFKLFRKSIVSSKSNFITTTDKFTESDFNELW